MGAVHFSLDPRLARILQETLRSEAFVETGTGQGDTVAAVRPLFSEIHTIEQDESLHAAATRRFLGDAAVHVHLGDSGLVLPRIAPHLESRAVLYWLDAHATGEAAVDGPECPLVEELTALSTLGERSVIVIDDARLFLAPPPPPRRADAWPSLATVLACLGRLSSAHETMVIDDVLVFLPASARGPVRDFARGQGVDWLQAMDKVRAYDALLEEARTKEAALLRQDAEAQEKDALIRRLDVECRVRDERLAALQEKEAALEQAVRERKDLRQIQEEAAAARAAEEEARRHRREAHYRSRRTLRARLSPKLGVLDQYPPRPLRFPSTYAARSDLRVPPLITLVTPSFGQAAYLERTLQSVLGQDYPRLEYVVQDGGSRDGSAAILERYRARLARCSSAPDRGQGHALNQGFSETKGDVMGYLNSDDLLLPGALHEVAAAFARHPEVDVVYGHRIVIDEQDREIGRWVLPTHDDAVLSWADYVPQETLFWRRRIWQRTGARIDESFRFALDWELLLRFRDAGARFLRLPRFLGCFRVHPAQKTSSQMEELGLVEMALLRRRCHGRAVTDDEIRRQLRPYLWRHLVRHKLYRLGVIGA
jgi:glycosyltransferase involved in cell wall biosynthesis